MVWGGTEEAVLLVVDLAGEVVEEVVIMVEEVLILGLHPHIAAVQIVVLLPRRPPGRVGGRASGRVHSAALRLVMSMAGEAVVANLLLLAYERLPIIDGMMHMALEKAARSLGPLSSLLRLQAQGLVQQDVGDTSRYQSEEFNSLGK